MKVFSQQQLFVGEVYLEGSPSHDLCKRGCLRYLYQIEAGREEKVVFSGKTRVRKIDDTKGPCGGGVVMKSHLLNSEVSFFDS